METCTVEKARNSLDALLLEAHRGKAVLIAAEDGRAVQLVPIPMKARKARKAGSARGQVWMSADFDAPLEDFADHMA